MAKLNWHPITRGGEPAGELLGAFELYLNEGAELPFMPPTRGDVYQVPSGIRPVMQLTRIEVPSVCPFFCLCMCLFVRVYVSLFVHCQFVCG